MQANRLEGHRYSHLYIDRPTGLRDGPRIRRRVASLFVSMSLHEVSHIAAYTQGETGESLSISAGIYGWTKFFETCPLDTFLDLPTIIAKLLVRRVVYKTRNWVDGVERILREEQAAYTLDELGGVHPYVDAAFNESRLTAIEALKNERYGTAAASLSKAYDNLHGSPVFARDAIRHAFDAAENIFKMMTGKARLTAGDAKGTLAAFINQQVGSADPVAQRAAHQMLSSFADWVDACHNYRHAPGEAEPPEPPEAVWQLLMTQAAGFIRWLAQLDQQTNRPS